MAGEADQRRRCEDGAQKKKKLQSCGRYLPLINKFSDDSAIVNFMCQLDGAVIPRYLSKYYSCVCEGDFWMRLTLKSVYIE